ncbi:hypothetical protein BDQ12DRAFT_676962 [Crucibulum laeve]|uniref:Uncharacterized protein n=1 Tax=Crucibulum laeve TaxID=68775 RepID=A0A5C3MCK1_9AGAR|nr:hypothetical protein BDQ12DRAFT_676962 [Crucibulum laeve]
MYLCSINPSPYHKKHEHRHEVCSSIDIQIRDIQRKRKMLESLLYLPSAYGRPGFCPCPVCLSLALCTWGAYINVPV